MATLDDRTVPVLISRYLCVRGDGDDPERQRPFGHWVLPDTGQIEMIAVVPRDAIVLPAHLHPEVRHEQQATVMGKGLPFGAHEPIFDAAGEARIGPPMRIDHLLLARAVGLHANDVTARSVNGIRVERSWSNRHDENIYGTNVSRKMKER